MPEQRFLCSPWCSTWRSRGEAEVPLQPVEDSTVEQVAVWEKPALEQPPGRTYGFVERGTYSGESLLAELVTPWGTHTGAVHEDLQLMGRTHIGEVHGGLCSTGRAPHWSRGKV